MWFLYAISGLVVLFVLGLARQTARWLREGRAHEDAGRYAQAVYCYTLAVRGKAPRRYRERIRHLWATYGPFDYAHVLNERENAGDEDRACNVAGHHMLMGVLREVLSETD